LEQRLLGLLNGPQVPQAQLGVFQLCGRPAEADQLGHSTPAFTLAVYGHSDAARARAAADAVGAVLWG